MRGKSLLRMLLKILWAKQLLDHERFLKQLPTIALLIELCSENVHVIQWLS